MNKISRALVWAGVLLLAPAARAGSPEPIKVRGTWVLDAEGRSSPVRLEARPRGLQTSGLVFRRGELWSVGDQRSEFPGCLFRLDPGTARLIGKPLTLELAPQGEKENPELAAYRGIPNSDFEGLALDPLDPRTLFAITEDKTPWIVEIRLEETDAKDSPRFKPRLVQLTPVHFPPGIKSWRDNPNYRWEGLAVSDDGKTMYLAFERAEDNLPRLCQLSLESARSGKGANPEVMALPFDSVPRRPDKEQALLNLNDIQFIRLEGRPALLAVARDQERLLVIDLDRKEIARIVDLDLLDPSGGAIEWVSPEGLAFDSATDRLWLINDPDSERQNYRARGEKTPSGKFADYAPLLFEMKLSAVLRAPESAGGK
jgi:hypothetical protein